MKYIVNRIFKVKGIPQVKNFKTEFADGSKNSVYNYYVVLFLKLFNILFDEKYDLQLEKSTLYEIRLKNWNKINGKVSIYLLYIAQVCFNYL